MSDENNSLVSVPKKPKVANPTRLGMIILIVFVGGFLVWGSFFKLESAAVANGKVVIESNRKTIQHLEGGIVKKIYVSEGSFVNAGDKLIELDNTLAQANLQQIEGQIVLLLAREAYLEAIRDKADKVVFPKRLLDKMDDPVVKENVNDAIKIFETRKEAISSGIEILKERIAQTHEEINSLQAQVKSNDTQLQLINQELNSWKELENKSYIDKPRVLALQREAAKLQGDKDQNLALIARAEQKISETELQITNTTASADSDALKLLEQTKFDLVGNLEKERAAKDILERTIIRSPITGTVLNLKVHTISGVITPREPLMDIVPKNEHLIIEARVNPQDIDVVHPGLVAKIRLTAYKQRSTPTIEGKVINVSGDLLYDDQGRVSFYVARIEVDPKEIQKIKHIALYPGMPVQVFIITANSTPLDYLLRPIIDSFTSAFRES